ADWEGLLAEAAARTDLTTRGVLL
ncbi:MAG: hypothetical protein QOK15_2181, partial [Nocardioidaceae bacterium]|nr:hypothetical protein [Nocardioidaceae bacterium]